MISALAFLMLSYASQAAELQTHPESKIANEYLVMLKEPRLVNHYNMDENGESIVTPEIRREEHKVLEDFLVTVAAKAEETPAFRQTGEILPVYELHNKYTTVGMLGFNAHLDATMLAYVLSHEAVDYVEEEETLQIQQNSGCTRQTNAQWGLARTTRSGTGDSRATYDYDNRSGRDVFVYVLDTGILRTHEEFQGRATWGFDPISNNQGVSPPRNDPNGHGTHVAGTIGGRLHGVAKNVRLVDVRVANARGNSPSGEVLAGLNWVAQQCRRRGQVCIANMSVGGRRSTAMNAAVDAASGNFVLTIAASMNDASDACNVSPASASTSIAVNNADVDNTMRRTSNFGSCTNIFAPGTSILSAYNRHNSNFGTLSGTSMAAPHVAGVAAKRLAQNPLRMTVPLLRNWILDNAATGMMRGDLRGSPNRYVRMTC